MATMYDALLRQLQVRLKDLPERHQQAYAALLKAPVYDLTNAHQPLKDFAQSQSAFDLPLRPPHDNLWVEFEVTNFLAEDDKPGVKSRFGVWLRRIQTLAEIKMLRPNRDKLHGAIGYELAQGRVVYHHEHFEQVLSREPDAKIQDNHPLGRVVQNLSTSIAALTPTGEEGTFVVFPYHTDSLPPDFHISALPLGITASDIPSDEGVKKVLTPVIRLMYRAFSLLNCRNVGTICHAAAPARPRETKRGIPPHNSFYTLEVHVPKSARARGVYPHDPAAPSVQREHLQRGHVKWLMSERYKEPGPYWWSAHWRGDPTLGRVEKDYAVVS